MFSTYIYPFLFKRCLLGQSLARGISQRAVKNTAFVYVNGTMTKCLLIEDISRESKYLDQPKYIV